VKTLYLKISCDNAAFEGDELYMETGRIMHHAAERFSDGQTLGTLYDSNGNKVGHWGLQEVEDEDDGEDRTA
jgi:hypothetical protein